MTELQAETRAALDAEDGKARGDRRTRAARAMPAGSTLSDIDGRPWTLDSDSLVASATPQVHEELLALMA